MKIDRHIGILAVLQQNRKVTAPYLAEKFEVSRRTINRDIEDICRAGIPIVTTQGQNGGISLMDGFCFDTTVFTEDELQSIFVGLKTLDSVSNTPKSAFLAQKINAPSADSMRIDLSSFYKESLSVKIELLKTAIAQHQYVTFHYYYAKGEEDKRIEPYLIAYQWADWYVFGWCTERKDFRLYKLRRLWELQLNDEIFTPREIPEGKKQFGTNFTDDYFITAIFDPSLKYRLVEDRGPGSFITLPDGRLKMRWGFTDPDAAVLWFLGFGDKVEILDPPEIRDKLKETARKVFEKYSES